MAKADRFRKIMAEDGAAVNSNAKGFNQDRYDSVGNLEDYEELKKEARAIKEDAIERLPRLIGELEAIIEANGGTLYLAEDEADANEYIREVVDGTEPASADSTITLKMTLSGAKTSSTPSTLATKPPIPSSSSSTNSKTTRTTTTISNTI